MSNSVLFGVLLYTAFVQTITLLLKAIEDGAYWQFAFIIVGAVMLGTSWAVLLR